MFCSQFTDKDSGTYKLVLKNNGGEVTTTATLNVDGRCCFGLGLSFRCFCLSCGGWWKANGRTMLDRSRRDPLSLKTSSPEEAT